MPGFWSSRCSPTRVSLSLAGLLARRVEWSTSVHAQPRPGRLRRPLGNFASTGASTQLNFALTQKLGVYAQYALYHYHVPADGTVVPTVSRGVATNRVSVGDQHVDPDLHERKAA